MKLITKMEKVTDLRDAGWIIVVILRDCVTARELLCNCGRHEAAMRIAQNTAVAASATVILLGNYGRGWDIFGTYPPPRKCKGAKA